MGLGSGALQHSVGYKVLSLPFGRMCNVKRLPGKCSQSQTQPSQNTRRQPRIFKAGCHHGSDLPSLSQAESRNGRERRGGGRRQEGNFSPAKPGAQVNAPLLCSFGSSGWSDEAKECLGQTQVNLCVSGLGERREQGRKTEKWEVVAWCWVWLRVLSSIWAFGLQAKLRGEWKPQEPKQG